MSTFIIQLGIMSLQASVAIVAVLILRWILTKAHISKKYVMFLWFIPFFLLICPWKISVPVGFWGAAPSDYNEQYTKEAMERWVEYTVWSEDLQSELKPEDIDGTHLVGASGQITENTDTPYHMVSEDILAIQKLLQTAGIIWAVGVTGLLFHAVVSGIVLLKKVSCCVEKTDGTCCVDDLSVPMVVGVFQPRIYLPSGMAEEYSAYVVEHEKTHIYRKDPLVKLAVYVIVCIHWFNLLAWLAYHFFEKDMEMVCDEETLRRIGVEQKKEYASALLAMSTGTRKIFAMPLAFGEGDTKERIKNVMCDKKNVKTAAILVGALGILILSVFMTKRNVHTIWNNGIQITTDTQQEETGTQGTPGQAENSETVYQNESDGKELTFAMVREAAANHTLHELDFHSYTNGEEWHFQDKNALNYYINFSYDYEGENYEIGVSYLLENDELWAVYVTRESDKEMRWLYQNKDGLLDQYSDFLEPLLATKAINIDEWLSLDLPAGYALGTYNAELGVSGGALILPQAYEVYEEELSAPPEWYHAGFIGKNPDSKSLFTFENGMLTDGWVEWWNHTSVKKIEVLNLDCQVLLTHVNHDLYSAAGAEALREAGVDVSEIALTSDYWYFFFVKEDIEDVYYLGLSQNLFTKEEAIAIAETVNIRE